MINSYQLSLSTEKKGQTRFTGACNGIKWDGNKHEGPETCTSNMMKLSSSMHVSLIALTNPVKRKQIQSCFSKLVIDNKTEWSILVYSTKQCKSTESYSVNPIRITL